MQWFIQNMLKNIIITATGSDKPGIVSDLTNIITNHGGNVEESRMSRLGSDFAIIMLVSVSLDWEESLEVALQSINDLTIITKSTKMQEERECLKCQIDLSGADNEGIVKVLSKYLAEKSINILDMQTHISNAPVTGTPLFNLMAITTIPSNIDLSEIQSDLSLIAQKLGVEITVNQSENMVETV